MAIRYVAPPMLGPTEREMRRREEREKNAARSISNLGRAFMRQAAIDDALKRQAADRAAADRAAAAATAGSQGVLAPSAGPTDAEREAMRQRTFLGDPLAFGDAAPGVLGRVSTGGVVSPSVAGGPSVDTAARQRFEESRQAARTAGLLAPAAPTPALQLDELSASDLVSNDPISIQNRRDRERIEAEENARAEAGRRQFEAELAAIRREREARRVEREMAERVSQREREEEEKQADRDRRMGEDRGPRGQSAARVAASPYSRMVDSDDSELRFFNPAIERILGPRKRPGLFGGMPEGDDPLPFAAIPATTEQYMDTGHDSTPQLIEQWRQWSNSPYAGTLEEGMAALKAMNDGLGDAWFMHFMSGTGRASEEVLDEMMYQMHRSSFPDVPLPTSRSKAAKKALENNVLPGDLDAASGMPLGDDGPRSSG